MRGSNELTINQETMIEALQYYFDNVLYKVYPKVTGITSDGYRGQFRVTVEEAPGPKDIYDALSR